MKIVQVQQGTQEWLDLRNGYFTASEAPAMMGASKYKTRQDLLREKATGIMPEIDAATQSRFDAGHAAEEKARAIISAQIGDLFPVTCTETVEGLPLLASMDGLTMDESAGWEHKLFNQSLYDAVMDHELDPHYYWQLEHQLLVTGAEHILFTVSDGTEENMISMEYRSWPDRRRALIAGWKQFAEDLNNYQHVEVAAKPTGKAPEQLPALHIEVTGMVTASNLAEFKAHAMAVFGGINTNLQTDEDFANADKTGKWCGEVEKKLEAAKAHALSQTTSIDELFRTIDAIAAEARRVRLDLEKQVKAQKESRRIDIMNAGKAKLAEHITALNNRIGKPYMPAVAGNFAEVMKGKKTISSLHNAVDTELARCKIEASEIADRITMNMNTLRTMADGYQTLFADTASIVLKANDDLVALIKSRIADFESEAKRKVESKTTAPIEIASAESISKTAVVQAVQATSPELAKLAEPYMPDFEDFWNNEGSKMASAKDIAKAAYIYGYNTGYKHAKDDKAA